ncbi:MAG TPA: tRNA pseudouridine(55) synthase TruB [Thermomicrobiales bacterium]|nr:tRNA pseudouridine(55) synthase TruB [Thermomicrobiales bacterium]
MIDKPAGWTSHDVVGRVRRLLGQRQVGHGGTLDPAATGVLPVAVGAATRVLEYVSDATKTYLAEITFGVETDSYDGDGTVVRTADPSALDEAAVATALSRFRGVIDQVPPMHAAIKVAGRPLYELARQGKEIERAPRRIEISALDLLDWQPPVATVLVDCSKGTYIRSLARDLGDMLGVGAYLSNLVRVRSGPFTLCDAWRLDELAERDLAAEWPEIALHPDLAMTDRPALIVDHETTRAWRDGQPIGAGVGAETVARAYTVDGEWIGVARRDPEVMRGMWRPAKVIASAA